MQASKLERRASFALSCGLLLASAASCRTQRTPAQKPAKAVLLQAMPSATATALATPSPSSSPSASPSASAWPAPIALSALKTVPKSAPLSALRAEPGLWLADESSALLSATPDPAWAEGPLTLTGGGSSATRGVALTRLPKALRGWLGRRVLVLGASGAVCETRLQRFALRAKVTPDPRTAEYWEGCAEGAAMQPETIAKEIWRLSAVGGRTLVAEFSAPCKGALLAVDPNLPAPAIAAPEPADAEVGAAVMAAFRRLPAYAALQARFRAEHPDLEGAWDDRDARRSVSKLALPGRPQLLLVSVETGSDCSGFSASLSALWEAGPNGPSKVLTAIDNHRLTPSAIVDLDDRGGSLLLGPDGPLQVRSVLRAGSYERSFLSHVPYFVGPC
jgi:hypothetical protein